ncbi:MAG: hypothetical protein KatS3mg098_279 [Candidatus Parcubacteria bacterium]|nr:MAG: hypothetical protein KatS3mg098_279 [Candidatus Parcubacteria bacterium]
MTSFKKLILVVFLGLMVAGLMTSAFLLTKKVKEFSKTYKDLSAQINNLAEENLIIERDIKYYLNPRNLEKKLREKFNYKHPSEKMIIVVP